MYPKVNFGNKIRNRATGVLYSPTIEGLFDLKLLIHYSETLEQAVFESLASRINKNPGNSRVFVFRGANY